ncbi:hypothetical protein D1007_48909 [Hordeum vulgare]|nr:hypothetical protein D1007_48909 [Hordeum vulgare]
MCRRGLEPIAGLHHHLRRPHCREEPGRLRARALPTRSSSSEDSPGNRVPGAALLEAPFASPGTAGLQVATRAARLLDGGLVSGTPRASGGEPPHVAKAEGWPVSGTAGSAARWRRPGRALPSAPTTARVGCCSGAGSTLYTGNGKGCALAAGAAATDIVAMKAKSVEIESL